jgi:hypothetical protein
MKLISLQVARSTIALTMFASVAQSALASTCPFDNGGSNLENDGLVLTRYALGLRGATMVANTSFAAGDAATIESTIACPSCGLRVTDDKDALSNPIFTVADATIISRRLAGFSGAALTNGVALGSGSRNTPAAVQSFLLAGCGATGGTVTSVGAGFGLVANGPNVVNNAVVSNGVLELAFGYILPQGCSAGQVPKSNGSGLWNCAADDAGSGSGTVSSITLGDGLTNNVAVPFTSGGTITTTGTITLPVSYRLPQTCAAGQVPVRGSVGQWECVDGPKKFINIGVTGVVLGSGATFNRAIGPSGGVTMPAAGGTPTISFSFMMPPDYTPGGTIEVSLVWNSSSTNCNVHLRENTFSNGRPGSDYAVSATQVVVVGGQIIATPSTAAQSILTRLSINPSAAGGAFLPGDAMIVGLFREARAGSGDNCTGDMRIQGISVTYQ